MEWLTKHMALVLAVCLFLTALISALPGRYHDLSTAVGLGTIGLLIFLIWLGTRNAQ